MIIVSEPSAKAAPRVSTDRCTRARNRKSAARSDTPRQPSARPIRVHTRSARKGSPSPQESPGSSYVGSPAIGKEGGRPPSPSTPLDMRVRIRRFVKPFGRDAARSGSGSSGKGGSSRCWGGQFIPIVAGKDMCAGDQQLRANHKTGPARRPSTSRPGRCCGSARPASRPRGPYESAVHPAASSTLSAQRDLQVTPARGFGNDRSRFGGQHQPELHSDLM
jgi:hypothetical protein